MGNNEMWRGTWMYAARARIGFFFAIVFRPLPHSEITGGIFWPGRAWELSRATWTYHRMLRYKYPEVQR